MIITRTLGAPKTMFTRGNFLYNLLLIFVVCFAIAAPCAGATVSSNPYIPNFWMLSCYSPPNSPVDMALSADGKLIYATDEAARWIVAIATPSNKVVGQIPIDGSPQGITFARDGRRAFASVMSYPPNHVRSGNHFALASTLDIIDTSTQTITAKIPLGNTLPLAIAVTRDTKTAYLTALNDASDGTVMIVDLDAMKVTTSIPLGRRPGNIVLNPDETKAFVGANSRFTEKIGGSVWVIDTKSASVSSQIPVGYSSGGVALDATGQTLFVATPNLLAFDATTYAARGSVSYDSGHLPEQIALAAEGTVGLVTTISLDKGGNDSVAQFDLKTMARKVSTDLEPTALPTNVTMMSIFGGAALRVSADGKTGYVLNPVQFNPILTVVDLPTATITKKIPLPARNPTAC